MPVGLINKRGGRFLWVDAPFSFRVNRTTVEEAGVLQNTPKKEREIPEG